MREEACGGDLPLVAQQALLSVIDQIEGLRRQRAQLDKHLMAWHRANPDSRRLATISGIGTVTASAIVAAVGDGQQFRSGREFAGLDWACATAEFEWRQGTTRTHLQEGKRPPAVAPCNRSHGALVHQPHGLKNSLCQINSDCSNLLPWTSPFR